MSGQRNRERRGGSGATILMGTTVVGKFGPRCTTQANWLENCETSLTPHVLRRMSHGVHDGYVMEKLQDIDLSLYNHTDVITSVLNLLERYIWSQDALLLVNWNVNSTLIKITDICTSHAFITPKKFNTLLTNVIANQGKLTASLTHGDPTFDNLMLRRGKIVIIDPVPSTPAIPDLRSVDTGKLLQSIVGYEALKYGSDSRWVCSADPFTFKNGIKSDLEWQATVMWCCIHLIRCLPYLPTSLHSGLADCVNNALDLI